MKGMELAWTMPATVLHAILRSFQKRCFGNECVNIIELQTERYENMVDHRSHVRNLSSCEV